MEQINKKNSKITWLWFLPPAALILFSFFIYYPTLWYGFIFDDFPTIIEYIHARSMDFWGLFFRDSRWISRILNQYTFTHWHQNPFAYRIFDVTLHLVIGAMVFFVVFRLFSRLTKNTFLLNNAYILALVTTGLFLLHPVQTQTVTYITQMRLEGLVVFFIFAVLSCFVLAVQATTSNRRSIFYGISFILTAFAAGSKEIIVALPILLALVDWFFVAEGNWESFKSRLLVHAGYFAIVLGFLWFYGQARPHNIVLMATTPVHNNRGNIVTSTPQEYITFFNYFISQFKILLHYIVIFFWPFGLSFDYDYRLSQSLFNVNVLFPLIALMSIVGAGIYLWLRNKINVVSFCIAWFFIGILPRASIFPGTELVCDYKTFVPSFGILLFISIALLYAVEKLVQYVVNNNVFKWTLYHHLSVWVMIFVLLGGATKVRNNVWSSEAALWWNVIENAPNKSRAYNNYAVALNESGKFDESIKYFQKAIEVDGTYAEPHVNLASIYHARGDRANALKHYMDAFNIGEGHPSLFNNLGLFYFEERDFARAEYCFNECLKLCPYFSRALRNLGTLYLNQGKLAQAEELYGRALKGDFVDADMFFMHGVLCHDLGKFDQAIESLKKVDPGYKDTASILAACLFNQRKYQDALPYLQKLCAQNPQNLSYVYNCALCLLNLGKSNEALPLFASCRQDSKSYPFAGLHYGRCLFEIGQKDQAKQELTLLAKATKDLNIKRDVLAYMKEVKIA